ncbi:MAG: glycosyltransferase family 9 protein [Chlorobiota bacterium]|nr:glycosyltransferase family 9 protein [Chlorobiota bacterium]QQS66143.1 MAG: glycosyltransferase family 9 protein [Chlorobiota bacterium]
MTLIPPKIKSIAVLQLGKLGDMILTTPLFNSIKELYPESNLTVIADYNSGIIAKVHPSVDHVISIQNGIMRIPNIISALRYKKYDLYIDHKNHFSRTSQMAAWFIKSQLIIIHHLNQPNNNGNYINLPKTIPPGHYVDIATTPLTILNKEYKFNRQPQIFISNEIQKSIDSRISIDKLGLIVINISAGSSDRMWTEENWKALIKSLSKKYSIGIISDPKDTTLANRLCSVQKNCRIIRTENILEAAAVIKRSLIVISSDTSIVHISSAFNKPCLALFSYDISNVNCFKPMSLKSKVVISKKGYKICDIEFEEVLEKFYEIEKQL